MLARLRMLPELNAEQFGIRISKKSENHAAAVALYVMRT
jgi:hypothetical protein